MDTLTILTIVKYVLVVLEMIASVVLIVLVLMQSSEEADLGSIAGKTGTYMNKNKGNMLDRLGAKYTKWVALAWGVLAFGLVILLTVINSLS